MEEKKIYYVRGSEKRPEAVLKSLIKLGAKGFTEDAVKNPTQFAPFTHAEARYFVSPKGSVGKAMPHEPLWEVLDLYGEEVKIGERRHVFQPYERVLCRNAEYQKWRADLYGYYDANEGYPYVCVGSTYNHCIPYEGNEHLLGTTNKP